MNTGLSGKVAVVSGGASGIGRAVADLLLAEGARVAVLDKNAPTESGDPAHLHPMRVDLNSSDVCERAVADVVRRFGRIDILVNNAGVNDGIGLDQAPSRFMESVERNLLHVFALTHFAAPALKIAQGAIVNVSSKVAETGQGKTSGYAAAKGAINALTREWAVALAPDKVRVNCVVPAECDTEQYQRWFQAQANPAQARQQIERLIPLGQRLTTPAEVAAMIVFLASPLASHVTGQVIHVDGGYTHLDRAATADREPWHSD